jgi:hypothetical protein
MKLNDPLRTAILEPVKPIMRNSFGRRLQHCIDRGAVRGWTCLVSLSRTGNSVAMLTFAHSANSGLETHNSFVLAQYLTHPSFQNLDFPHDP